MSKFKVDDKIRVVADKKRLEKCGIWSVLLTGKTGVVKKYRGRYASPNLPYYVQIDDGGNTWNLAERDLELAEQQPTTFVGHPDGRLEVRMADSVNTEHKISIDVDSIPGPPIIRTFDTGATRDTIQGKLDYVKALSPIVLRRYLQYLDKHRLQSDGNMRDFDNWKKGIPQSTYHSSKGRHFMAAWLIEEGYTVSDNHGPVDEEDALCGEMFNTMGKLHEILKKKVDRTTQ